MSPNDGVCERQFPQFDRSCFSEKHPFVLRVEDTILALAGPREGL